MYKAGDKFEVVRSNFVGEEYQPGTIITATEDLSPGKVSGFYSIIEDHVLHFAVEGELDYPCLVRPLRTEAEKRGAKFGVMGVEKDTGKRVVFNSVRKDKQIITGEEVWIVMREDVHDTTVGIEASKIRLDHEPEYKEITFSEATHDQRMDASLVVTHDGESPIEVIFTKGNVYVYQFKSMWMPVCIHDQNVIIDCGLKIRIPA